MTRAKAFSVLLSLAAYGLLGCHAALAEEFEATSGRTSPDYIRARLPDGSFKPETYAFGKGGYWGGPLHDKTIDAIGFLKIAHIMAVPLAAQHHVPDSDPKTTSLLIMVYWGTTHAPEHANESAEYENLMDAMSGNTLRGGADPISAYAAAAQAENRIRDMQNAQTAKLLGYDSWWEATFDARPGTPQAYRRKDMMNELEEYRYFVVLMAYDFQLLWKQRKHKLLWETRFSIREHVNSFDQQLPAMAEGASRYFGRDSGGLAHDTLPEGNVELGKIKDLGALPGK
ncbi:MAG TPA: hypothetical protein VGG34_00510 [Opitutaceae bacterium]|jgi:hypothetical protein